MKTLDRHTGVSQSNIDVAIIYIYIYISICVDLPYLLMLFKGERERKRCVALSLLDFLLVCNAETNDTKKNGNNDLYNYIKKKRKPR